MDSLVIPVLNVLITQYVCRRECFQTFCYPKRYREANLNGFITDNFLLVLSEFMTVIYLEDEIFTKFLSLMGKPRSLHSLQGKQLTTSLNSLFRHHKTVKKLTYFTFLLCGPIQQFFSSVF